MKEYHKGMVEATIKGDKLAKEELIASLNDIECLEKDLETATKYIKEHQRKDGFLNLNEWQTRDLLDIL